MREPIARHEIGPLPGVALPVDRLAQFRAECARLGSTHAQLERLGEVPREVARYLDGNHIAKRVVAWSELAALGWRAPA